jgi:serine/threonine protein kinase
MSSLQPHKNIAQIYGVCEHKNKTYVIMEYLPGGSLDRMLQLKAEGKTISGDERIRLAAGIASGMVHLHAQKIIHRDLATRNILISSDNSGLVPKVSDFGFSRYSPAGGVYDDMKVAPIRWMAPESLQRQHFSTKSDVFSFGILLWGPC